MSGSGGDDRQNNLGGTKRLREGDDDDDGKDAASMAPAVRIKTETSLNTTTTTTQSPSSSSLPTQRQQQQDGAGTTTTSSTTDANVNAATSKKLPWYHSEIPNTAHYHVSWMHADTVTHVAHVGGALGVVVTASRDGVIKFWKRQSVTASDGGDEPLEFVKAVTAHAAPVVSLCITNTGPNDNHHNSSSKSNSVAASVDSTGRVQFYDLALFDAAARLHLGHRWPPSTATWVNTTVDAGQVLVVATVSGPLQVVSPESATILQSLWMHGQDTTVTALVYNPIHQCVLSGDQRGMLQMWDTHGDYVSSSSANIDGKNNDQTENETPTTMVHIGATVTARRNRVKFTSRLDTQLLHLHQKQTHAVSMAVTPITGNHYAVYGADLRVRLFVHETGQLLCTYDERLKVYDAQHTLKPYHLDAMEYGRRAAMERELAAPSKMPSMQLQFESTEEKYLLVPTLMGIKVIDWKRHKLVKLVGSADAAQQRFVGLCQCAGPAVVDTQLQLARQQDEKGDAPPPAQLARSERDDAAVAAQGVTQKITDALLIAWAYKSRRFFVFSHIDPTIIGDNKDDDAAEDALVRRDHWNEQPDASDTAAAALASTTTRTSVQRLATQAVIHTTLGDIHVQLFGTQTPKTIENFSTHARNGYYDGLLFHRVIKGFMLQTGDPKGDGTGGESIWGGEFADEIVTGLRHDRPFTLSMANAGPNTNGSQFFITTVPCPWLDGKHTVFGRVQRGMDVCALIENVKTDDNDKPLKEVQIINIDIS